MIRAFSLPRAVAARALGLLFWVLVSAHGASADDLHEIMPDDLLSAEEGADDPQLRQAFADWLNGEDEDALKRLRAKAEDGNLAAQIALAQIGGLKGATRWIDAERLRHFFRAKRPGRRFAPFWRSVAAERSERARLFPMRIPSGEGAGSAAFIEKVRALVALGEHGEADVLLHGMVATGIRVNDAFAEIVEPLGYAPDVWAQSVVRGEKSEALRRKGFDAIGRGEMDGIIFVALGAPSSVRPTGTSRMSTGAPLW